MRLAARLDLAVDQHAAAHGLVFTMFPAFRPPPLDTLPTAIQYFVASPRATPHSHPRAVPLISRRDLTPEELSAGPRPPRRRRWLLAALALALPIVLVLGIYAILAYDYYSYPVVIANNYAAELNAPILAVPEEQRGWTHYRKALLMMEREHAPKTGETAPKPGEVNWDARVEYLRRNRLALAAVRRAAAIRPLGFVLQDAPAREEVEWQIRHGVLTAAEAAVVVEPSENPDLMKLVAPTHVMRMLSLSGLLAADCHLAAIERDDDRVFANLTSTFGMAEQIAERSFLIDELIAATVRESAYHLAASVLAMRDVPLSDNQLAALAKRLRVEGEQGPVRIHLGDERLYFLDWLQRYFTDHGDGDGSISPEGLAQFGLSDFYGDALRPPAIRWLPVPLAARQVATRRESKKKYDECWNEVQRLGGIPLWRRPRTTSLFEHDAELSLPRFWLVASAFDHMEMLLAAAEQRTQRRDALMVAVALVRHHRMHLAWPKTLSELSPEILKSVPPDRFDGQPLRYRLNADRPVLYSIGSDLDDDGGTPGDDPDNPETVAVWPPNPSVDGDWVLWPPIDKKPAVTMILKPSAGDTDSDAVNPFGPPQPPEPPINDIKPDESQMELPIDEPAT
jgi:hypothetical protein